MDMDGWGGRDILISGRGAAAAGTAQQVSSGGGGQSWKNSTNAKFTTVLLSWNLQEA
jgi:hypothetical protein